MRTALALALLIAAAPLAHAQQHGHDAARAAVLADDAEENGLESIGEEAAEVGADDDAGLGGPQDEVPAGGMGRVEDEMVGAADEDGCTGDIGQYCEGGDN